MRLRTLAAAAALAVGALFAGPAKAEFTNGHFNEFMAFLNNRTGLTDAQQKAVDQANALAGKEYTSFSKELAAYSKIVKTVSNAFAGHEAVMAFLEDVCDDETAPLNGIFTDLTFGSDGTGAAVVQLSNKMGVVKGALTAQKWIMQHLTKGSTEADCSKKLKFYSKAAKGAEKVFKKYGPLDT